MGFLSSGINMCIGCKPDISIGGQILIVTDISRIRLCAYIHHHKLHNFTPPLKKEVPKEVQLLF